MTARARRRLGLAATLVPAAQRERFREEWDGNIAAATEIGENPDQLSRAALRTAAGMRLTALTSAPGPLALVGTAVAVFGVMAVAAVGMPLIPVATVAILAGMALVAAAASRALGSGTLPWALFAALSTGLAVAVASVIEINLLFAANDSNGIAGPLVPAMIATGVVGVAALAASIALTVALLVALGRRDPRSVGLTRA